MKRISVLGLGKVGTLVAVLLQRQFEVVGLDKNQPHYEFDLPFKYVQGDVSDAVWLKEQLSSSDAVVSALPYFLNKEVAQICLLYTSPSPRD